MNQLAKMDVDFHVLERDVRLPKEYYLAEGREAVMELIREVPHVYPLEGRLAKVQALLRNRGLLNSRNHALMRRWEILLELAIAHLESNDGMHEPDLSGYAHFMVEHHTVLHS